MSGVAVTDRYTLELIDKILAPLKAIEKQAAQVNETMERLEKMASGGLGLAKLAGGIGLAVGGLMGRKSALGGVLHVMERAAEGAWEFGKAVIGASRFRSQNIMGLDLFLGKGKGEGTFNRALNFGQFLPMDERDVVRQVTDLAGAGYKGKQLNAANAALADVQAYRGDFYKDNLKFHLQRLKNEAAPMARDVNQIAIDAGVGMEGIFKQIYAGMGKALPKNANTDAGQFAMKKQYEEWVHGGQVSGNAVINATLRAISERYDNGGKLGGAAIAHGNTLGGLVTNLAAAPERFLMQMKMEDMPGIQSVMEFIKKLLVFFDHGTEQGKRLTSIVEKMINTLFGGLDKITGEDLGRFFESGVKMAEKLTETVKSAWNWVDQLLHGDTTDFLDATKDVFISVGKLIGQGIWEGMTTWGSNKKEQELRRTGGMSDGQYDAAVKEITGQALRGGEITAEIIKHAGGSESPVMKAVIADLARMGNLPTGLQGQVTSAREHFGMNTGVQAKEHDAIADLLAQQDDAEEVGRNLVRGHVKGAKEEGDMHSPSRVTEEQGRNLVEGFIEGIREAIDNFLGPGGESATLTDQIIEVLRASAQRQGVRV